jgi:hypothetical protein
MDTNWKPIGDIAQNVVEAASPVRCANEFLDQKEYHKAVLTLKQAGIIESSRTDDILERMIHRLGEAGGVFPFRTTSSYDDRRTYIDRCRELYEENKDVTSSQVAFKIGCSVSHAGCILKLLREGGNGSEVKRGKAAGARCRA